MEGSDTESSEDEDNCLSDDNTSLDDVTVNDNEVFGDFDYGTDTGGTSMPDEMDVTLEKWFPLRGERAHSLKLFCMYDKRFEISKIK